jgi:kinetochore protein Nuf2
MLMEMLDLGKRAGYTDVCLEDFVSPKPKKLQLLLSALINFVKFREDKMEGFQVFTNQASVLLEQRVALETKEGEMQARRAQKAEQAANVEAQLASVTAEGDIARAAVNQLSVTQHQLRTEIKEEKDASHAIAEKLSAVMAQVAAAQAELAKVNSQIVHEPEKLKATLKDMTNQMQQGRALTQVQTHKLKSLQNTLGQYSRVEEKVSSRVELINSAAAAATNVHKLRKSIADQAAQSAAISASMSELDSQEETLKENYNQAQDKLLALQAQFEGRRIKAAAALEQVESEKEALERELQSQRQTQAAADALVQQKRQMLQLSQQKHAAQMVQMSEKCEKLRDAAGSYHAHLEQVMHAQQQQEVDMEMTACR